MAQVKSNAGTAEADAAIHRVLEAEQVAIAEVSACRRQALGILQEARSRMRSKANRTDRRINRIHTLCDAAIARELASIAAESATLTGRAELTPRLLGQLDGALARLVDEMLGVRP